ncbi:MAG: AAA family ATPase [Endomicrobium sp.]|jgi:hypothetical protein|nr:AAA family ATPase [Endomicrobium sp.]
MHKLISTGSVYFLCRPRRFGKSLLISTFKELFKGNKKSNPLKKEKLKGK